MVEIQTSPERDEDTGQFVATYGRARFTEAIEELGRDASTQAVADEVQCQYYTTYKALIRMEEDDAVTGRMIGNSRLWEVNESGEDE